VTPETRRKWWKATTTEGNVPKNTFKLKGTNLKQKASGETGKNGGDPAVYVNLQRL